MKNIMKKVIKLASVAAFVAVAGYGVYANQTSGAMSDLALANVEALAQSEIEIYHDFHLVQEGSCQVCRRSGGTCNVHSQVPC